jgi:hypothetical protein
MARMIETEMSDCLEQMAKFQAKMEYLQQEKNKLAEEAIKKENEEPNMKVMSDWLNTYGEMIDEIERERVIVEDYNELQNHINMINIKIIRYKKIIKIEELTEENQKLKELRDFIRETREYDTDPRKVELGYLLQLRLKYTPTKREHLLYNNREIITDKYLYLYENRKRNSERVKVLESRKKLLINSPRFILNNQPTYFMKQYIEATHNMFLIQQKRINELEKKIEEINLKL